MLNNDQNHDPQEVTGDRRDAQGKDVEPGPVIYRVTGDEEATRRRIAG